MADKPKIDRSGGGIKASSHNSVVPVQPGVLRVEVANGNPGQSVSFYIDADEKPIHTGTFEDSGTLVVYLPINKIKKGKHVVRVVTDV